MRTGAIENRWLGGSQPMFNFGSSIASAVWMWMYCVGLFSENETHPVNTCAVICFLLQCNHIVCISAKKTG